MPDTLTTTSVTYRFDIEMDVSEFFPPVSDLVDRVNSIMSRQFGYNQKLSLLAHVYSAAVTCDHELSDRDLDTLASVIKTSLAVAVKGWTIGVTVRREGSDA